MYMNTSAFYLNNEFGKVHTYALSKQNCDLENIAFQTDQTLQYLTTTDFGFALAHKNAISHCKDGCWVKYMSTLQNIVDQ